MEVLEMKIKVDSLPDGCCAAKEVDEGCVFNCDKYCVLKQALNHRNCFVHNNRGVVPNDCPLKRF